MYATMTAADLIEWEQFYECDPWGPERIESLFGMLCSLTDACHRAKGQAEKPIHYMPFVKALTKAPQKAMTLDQAKSLFRRAKQGFEAKKK
jgi:hypothetical protein